MTTDPKSEQLEPSTELLPQRIKRHVLESIVSGELAPGERIYEIRLARALGTSQAPVREALRELAAIGLVEITPRRGAYVRTMDSKELVDSTVLRAEIDALAARLAAPVITTAGLEHLANLQDQMRSYVGDNDVPRFAAANSEFHGAVAKESLNAPVIRAYKQLEPFAKTYISATLPQPHLDTMLAEHEEILDRLTARDSDGAALAARNHQLHVAKIVIEQILEEDAEKTRESLQIRLGTTGSSNP